MNLSPIFKIISGVIVCVGLALLLSPISPVYGHSGPSQAAYNALSQKIRAMVPRRQWEGRGNMIKNLKAKIKGMVPRRQWEGREKTINQLNRHIDGYKKDRQSANQAHQKQLAAERKRHRQQRGGYERRLKARKFENAKLQVENYDLKTRNKTILSKIQATMGHYERQIKSCDNIILSKDKRISYLESELKIAIDLVNKRK